MLIRNVTHNTKELLIDRQTNGGHSKSYKTMQLVYSSTIKIGIHDKAYWFHDLLYYICTAAWALRGIALLDPWGLKG